MSPELVIRPMAESDATPVAALAGHLGYPSSEGQVQARLRDILGRNDAAALVAEESGRLVAWLHVEMRRTLVADREAQVMALVVDEASRSRGVGAALMTAAEDWARARGAERVRVGSRVTRTDAHRFYERIGYALSKTSHWFEKRLCAGTCDGASGLIIRAVGPGHRSILGRGRTHRRACLTLLDTIHDPAQLPRPDDPELEQLKMELREKIFRTVQSTGGHLARLERTARPRRRAKVTAA